MTVKFSSNFKAIEKRLTRLPKLVESVFFSFVKRDAIRFIDSFQKHIENNDLFIDPLQETTVSRKESLGYDKPDTPLYGEGRGSDNSYLNMFLMKRIHNGWQVYPRWAKHHKAALQLRELLDIHEFGATINNNGTLIRIPPRPVAFLTYKEVLNRRKKKEGSQKVKRAINQYIVTGQENLLEKIASREEPKGKELQGE